MLMGKVVSKRTYSLFEYVTAIMISIGLFLFLLTSEDSMRGKGKVTTISGVVILIGYLVFDAFTSNWQGELFKTYKMSSLQMMAGVNLFSVLLTSISLFEQGMFVEAFAFVRRHPLFGCHVLVLSGTSAVGQLFIFYTISKFGPVTFTIIMTVRQGLAILLSCMIFQHPVSVAGAAGISLVFIAIFIRIYHGQNKKAKSSQKNVSRKPDVAAGKSISSLHDIKWLLWILYDLCQNGLGFGGFKVEFTCEHFIMALSWLYWDFSMVYDNFCWMNKQ